MPKRNYMGGALETITIYTDGAARGNPGESASGFAVYDGSGRLRKSHSAYNGTNTNNYAEYRAVILALQWCKNNLKSPRSADIELYSDSQLVVRQLTGMYKVKAPAMAEMNRAVVVLAGIFRSVRFHNVPREHEGIRYVDARLNELLDRKEQEKG